MSQPAVAHMVYFTLKEGNEQNRQQLVSACGKYLTDHPGTLFYGTGTRVPDLAREVNDQEFDVGLHIIFQSRADHDRYQVSERHQTFIAENRPNWQRVRVFDAYVPASAS